MATRRKQGNGARRAGAAFARLVRIMAALRGRHGCPWDHQQTHASLRPFLLEETYEALETIDRGDVDALRGELGDVLFQCVFHAQIASEGGGFDATDVVRAITDKLIRRHPHVFSAAGRPLSPAARRRRRMADAKAVLEQWEQIKAREKKPRAASSGLLAGVPRTLPSLLRAFEIGSRASSVGFDWSRPADVLDKIDEEVRELRGALTESPARAAEELGDLLFSIANLARQLQLEPEAALRRANDKFTRRFAEVERQFAAEGRMTHGATPLEFERAWESAKAIIAASDSTSTPLPPSSSPRPKGRRTRARPRRRDRS